MTARALVIGLVAGMLAPAIAAAQPIATDPPAATPVADRPHDPHPPAGLGGRIGIGTSRIDGIADATLFQLEYDLLPVLAPRGTKGPMMGFRVGFTSWRAGTDNWGFDLPMQIVIGARVWPVRMTLGLGLDAVLVDQVADDTGVGFYAPFAAATAGFDVHGFSVVGDVRLTRRWQFGADDHTQWTFALALGYTWEAPTRQPRY